MSFHNAALVVEFQCGGKPTGYFLLRSSFKRLLKCDGIVAENLRNNHILFCPGLSNYFWIEIKVRAKPVWIFVC